MEAVMGGEAGGVAARRGAVSTPTRRLIVFGVIFWAIGVAAIRAMLPLGVFSAGAAPALLLLTLPVTWATTRLIGRVAPCTDLVKAAAMASMPAVLLDGVVLTFAPWVYTSDPARQVVVGAWLLWFIGGTIASAFLRAGR